MDGEETLWSHLDGGGMKCRQEGEDTAFGVGVVPWLAALPPRPPRAFRGKRWGTCGKSGFPALQPSLFWKWGGSRDAEWGTGGVRSINISTGR